jgi:hypothetical protein
MFSQPGNRSSCARTKPLNIFATETEYLQFIQAGITKEFGHCGYPSRSLPQNAKRARTSTAPPA